jgi:hypothetical protein
VNNTVSQLTLASVFLNVQAQRNILLESTPEVMNIVKRYYQLRILSHPSNKEANEMGDILELAITDEVIDFWITEIDHALAHRLNLLNEAYQSSYRNQQAFLREYLGVDKICEREFFRSKSQINSDKLLDKLSEIL